METSIALLLLVMPGYLVRLVCDQLEDGIREKDKFQLLWKLCCMRFLSKAP